MSLYDYTIVTFIYRTRPDQKYFGKCILKNCKNIYQTIHEKVDAFSIGIINIQYGKTSNPLFSGEIMEDPHAFDFYYNDFFDI